MKSFENTAEEIKLAVEAMKREREISFQNDAFAHPSSIWPDILSQYDYLLDLSASNLKRIRWHTLQFSIGDYYSMFYPKPNPKELSTLSGHDRLIKNIPGKYWLSEPQAEWIQPNFNFSWQYMGKWINRNIIYYQKTITNLYHIGYFSKFNGSRPLMLEVGPWYGGLMNGLFRCCGKNATCILVDFPEILVISALFIALSNPDARCFIYHPDKYTPELLKSKTSQYDFIFLPNYRWHELTHLDSINLFINTHSFQEMSDLQVDIYLNTVAEKLNGFLYSDNLDRHPYNPNLGSLTKQLDLRFNLTPTPAYYDELWKEKDPLSYECSRIYCGLPKTNYWKNFNFQKLAIPDQS